LVRLVAGTIGATFHITIPDRAVELGARRRDTNQKTKSRRA
jgi:hypothetical protein